MLDFPASPSNGQAANGYTFNTAASAWLKSGKVPVWPPSDGNEYVKSNGVWRKKTERKSLQLNSTVGIVFYVPEGAKRCRYTGVITWATAVSCQVRCIVEAMPSITGATPYHGVGYIQRTTATTGSYLHQSEYNLTYWVMGEAHDNVATPFLMEGIMNVERGNTSEMFSGQCHVQAYNASVIYTYYAGRMDVAPASTTALRLDDIIFYGSASVNWTADSWIEMEWFY